MTKHIGTCPCCEKTFKVQGAGQTLALHGFERPGWGFVVGNCFGTRKTPHELSPETAKAYSIHLRDILVKTQEQLATSTLDELSQKQLEMRVSAIRQDIKRMDALAASWERQELTTEAEVLKVKEASKAKVTLSRAAKKAAKLAKWVEKFQGQIDKASKKSDSKTLAEIWQYAQSKLCEIDTELTYAEALKMLDRDAVWAQYGLQGMVQSHRRVPWNESPEKPILDKMMYTEEELVAQAERDAYLTKINGRG